MGSLLFCIFGLGVALFLLVCGYKDDDSFRMAVGLCGSVTFGYMVFVLALPVKYVCIEEIMYVASEVRVESSIEETISFDSGGASKISREVDVYCIDYISPDGDIVTLRVSDEESATSAIVNEGYVVNNIMEHIDGEDTYEYMDFSRRLTGDKI